MRLTPEAQEKMAVQAIEDGLAILKGLRDVVEGRKRIVFGKGSMQSIGKHETHIYIEDMK